MAVNLEAIRRRIEELNGNRSVSKNRSSVQLWKPEVGAHKVRIIPWPEDKLEDGQPFIERWFYYFVKPSILSLHQFGKPDPINELIRKLYSSGTPSDKELAKKLRAKPRTYAAVIVRGRESEGPMVWAFGSMIQKKLLAYFVNSDVGDITDPDEGFDLDVVVTQIQGKEFPDTEVEAGRRPRKLSDNPEEVKKWLASTPDISELYTERSYKEVEKALNDWLSTGAADGSSDGTSRGSQAKPDVLDEIANDVKGEKSVIEKPKKTAAKKPSLDDDETPKPKKSLDDAFKELMDNDDE